MRKRIALVLGAAVMSLGMAAAPKEPAVVKTGCLICDTFGTKHYDFQWFGSNDQHGGGGYHPGNGSAGTCGEAHLIYAGGETLVLFELANNEMRFLTAYLENDDAVLNTERRAVQVIVNGVVYAHIPVDDGLYAELLSASDTKLLQN